MTEQKENLKQFDTVFVKKSNTVYNWHFTRTLKLSTAYQQLI